MNIEVELSDLVMLQMLGELDTYLEEIDEGDRLIEEAERAASVTDVFDEIIENSAESQFGDPQAFVRELAQNAKDAYPRGFAGRDIEFELEDDTWPPTLTVRDYGKGMSPEELISDLLIPYNSSKELDPETVGEHGVGWYSVFSAADELEVVTGRDGVRTCASVYEEDGWMADIKVEDEVFDGTLIEVTGDRRFLEYGMIYNALRKHVGHVDPSTASISLNGEQVNTLMADYKLGGAVMVENEGVRDELELYVDESGDARGERTMLVTQDGLYVREEQNLFPEGSLHHAMFEELSDYGFSFRVDLPGNVGLTKGRKDVVAGQKEAVYDAVAPAFEQYVLEDVLASSGQARTLDMRLSDFMEDVLAGKYTSAVMRRKWRDVPVLGWMGDIGVLLGEAFDGLLDRMTGSGSYGSDEYAAGRADTGRLRGFFDLLSGDEDGTDEEEEAEELKAEYSDMSRFAQRVMEKPLIPAVEDGELGGSKASVEDVVEAYVYDELRFVEEHGGSLELVYPTDAGLEGEGLYVDGAFPLSRSIQQVILEQEKDEDVEFDLAGRLRRVYERLVSAFGGSDRPVADTWDEPLEIERTGFDTVSSVVDESGVGREYCNVLEAAGYLEAVMAEANGMERSPVMLHYEENTQYFRGSGGMEVAHAIDDGISFNIASSASFAYVEDARDGELEEGRCMHLIDVLAHEKAHTERDAESARASHGNSFYRRKEEIRDGFVRYCVEEEIDPLEEVNERMVTVEEDDRIEPRTFGEYVDEYSGFNVF